MQNDTPPDAKPEDDIFLVHKKRNEKQLKGLAVAAVLLLLLALWALLSDEL